MDKYEKLNDKYFGFEIFDEIIKTIDSTPLLNNDDDNTLFKIGIARAKLAVRNLKEEYYKEIINFYTDGSEITK